MNRIKFNRPIPANPFTTVLDEFFTKGLNELSKSTNTTSRPSVNILEKDDAFVVELAAPGLKKEDFHINLDKDQLVIKVEQKQEEKAEAGDETNSEKEAYRRREFNYSSFSRTFHIPETINTDEIKAVYVDGILSLSLSKKEEAKEKEPRTIAIS